MCMCVELGNLANKFGKPDLERQHNYAASLAFGGGVGQLREEFESWPGWLGGYARIQF